MQSIWEEIREGIMATLRSSTPAQFTALQEACPSLARFRDAIAVASWLITREDNGERNLAYRELVRVVQSSDTPPQLATTLLYSGLWAPLDHIYNDLQSELPNAKERASRVCSQFANQIKSMNLDNVNKVAATLVQNVRRDAWAELGKDWRESDQQLGDEVLLAVPATDQNSEDVVSDAESMLKILTAIWAIVGKRDAELLRLAYVVGQPHAVTAEQLGMTEAQVRQRVSRAIRKVQNNSPTWLSQKAGVICMYRKGGSSRTAGATDGDV